MATGVLPVFVGYAAKAVDLQPNHDKTYRATIRFGLATDTGDITGETLRTQQTTITAEQMAALLPQFVGDQMQVPPMYSAVKINGVALYKLARQGQTVERKARPITIHSLTFLGQSGQQDFDIEVSCSKGTYIRTLLEDIGTALDVPACLAALRRTQAGVFDLSASHTLEDVQAARDENRLEELFLPTEMVFTHLPELTVNEKTMVRLHNGAPCKKMRFPDGIYRIKAPEGFVGLGRVSEETLKVEKLFVERV